MSKLRESLRWLRKIIGSGPRDLFRDRLPDNNPSYVKPKSEKPRKPKFNPAGSKLARKVDERTIGVRWC